LLQIARMAGSPLTDAFPTSCLADNETIVKPPADRAGDIVWLNPDDVLDDDETDTTLRVPQYASVAIGGVVSPLSAPVSPLPVEMPPAMSDTEDPPRRRRSLLARVTPVLCVVAIVFELGWLGGSRLAPQSEPPLAATKSASMRTVLLKAPRALAPPEEPQPQAPVQKPAPKFFGFLVPASTASAPPAVPSTAAPTVTAAPTATATAAPTATATAARTATASATVAPRPTATATGGDTTAFTPKDL
jgi:hypothetical protein